MNEIKICKFVHVKDFKTDKNIFNRNFNREKAVILRFFLCAEFFLAQVLL